MLISKHYSVDIRAQIYIFPEISCKRYILGRSTSLHICRIYVESSSEHKLALFRITIESVHSFTHFIQFERASAFPEKTSSVKIEILTLPPEFQKASIFYNSLAMGNSRAIYGHHYLCINGPWPKYLQLLLWCSTTLIHDSTTLSTEMLCMARMKMSVTASHPL